MPKEHWSFRDLEGQFVPPNRAERLKHAFQWRTWNSEDQPEDWSNSDFIHEGKNITVEGLLFPLGSPDPLYAKWCKLNGFDLPM